MNGVSGGGTIRHDFLKQIDDEENFTSNEKLRKNSFTFTFRVRQNSRVYIKSQSRHGRQHTEFYTTCVEIEKQISNHQVLVMEIDCLLWWCCHLSITDFPQQIDWWTNHSHKKHNNSDITATWNNKIWTWTE